MNFKTTKITIKVKKAITNEEKTLTFNREEIKIDNVLQPDIHL